MWPLYDQELRRDQGPSWPRAWASSTRSRIVRSVHHHPLEILGNPGKSFIFLDAPVMVPFLEAKGPQVLKRRQPGSRVPRSAVVGGRLRAPLQHSITLPFTLTCFGRAGRTDLQCCDTASEMSSVRSLACGWVSAPPHSYHRKVAYFILLVLRACSVPTPDI